MSKPSKVERLKITSYEDPARAQPVNGQAPEVFEFLINSDEITTRHENKFSRYRGINTSGRTATYAFSNSDEMNLQLTLDNTLSRQYLPGGSPLESEIPVQKTIEEFLKYCFYMDGEIHEPRYLTVAWGSFSFECRLKSVAINYSKFSEQGVALRANLDAVFIADMPDAKRVRLENKKSPDITHSRTVLEGQTLTGLTKEVYGDSSHFLAVARANDLDHIRRLKPGSRLHFPPLEK